LISAGPDPATATPALLRGLLPVLLVSTLLLLLAVVWYGGGLPLYWELPALIDTALFIVVSAVLAFVLHRQDRARAAPQLVLCALLYLAFGLGLATVAATLLLVSASWLYGRLLLCLLFGSSAIVIGISRPLLLGLALLLALLGLLIHLPVNHRWLHLLLLATPLLLVLVSGRLPDMGRQLATALQSHNTALSALPWYCFAPILILLVAVARNAFFPSLFFDDNALHLRLWTQLLHEQRYNFDVTAQVWEVAPFLVDLLHGTLSLVAGADARGAMNLMLLALLYRQLWVLLRMIGLTPASGLLLLLLFTSTPLLANLLLSLQTELMLALLATAGTRMVLELQQRWFDSSSVTLAAIAALCCATKLPGAVLGLMLLAAGVLRLWPLRAGELWQQAWYSRVVLALFMAALTVLALNSYLTAWWHTGNPLFPLYNGIFRSPFFPAENFSDMRWLHGFNPASYVELFFNTSAYFEARNFTAGFQYLLLLPFGFAAMVRRTSPLSAAALLLPLLGYGLAMFASTQYWRYQFPVFPLAIIVIGFLLLPGPGRSPFAARSVHFAVGACLFLNFWFHPGISGFFPTPPGHLYTETSRRLLTELHAPAKALTAWVNLHASGSRVLYPPETPAGATLLGTPLYVNWYAPAREASVLRVQSPADVVAFLDTEAVDLVIWRFGMRAVPGDLRSLFRQHFAEYGYPLLQYSNTVLYRLGKTPLHYTERLRIERRSGGTLTGGSEAGRSGGTLTGDSEAGSEGTLTVGSSEGTLIGRTPLQLAQLQPNGAVVARLRTRFRCDGEGGALVAQVNWDVGTPYYREIACTGGWTDFLEAFAVPASARQGWIHASVLDAGSAEIDYLALETN
jgi:hypothetical protein